MAQNEYYLWSPHEKAKLYKRYTGDITIDLKDNETITIQDNRYVYIGKFTWIEETSQETSDDQPLEGLIVQNGYITIKTNSLKQFETGDIIMLPKSSKQGGTWIVNNGIGIDYVYTPKQLQTYQHIPLSTVG